METPRRPRHNSGRAWGLIVGCFLQFHLCDFRSETTQSHDERPQRPKWERRAKRERGGLKPEGRIDVVRRLRQGRREGRFACHNPVMLLCRSIALGAGLLLLVARMPAADTRTPTQEGLVYGEADGEKLTMDYYAPRVPGLIRLPSSCTGAAISVATARAAAKLTVQTSLPRPDTRYSPSITVLPPNIHTRTWCTTCSGRSATSVTTRRTGMRTENESR